MGSVEGRACLCLLVVLMLCYLGAEYLGPSIPRT